MNFQEIYLNGCAIIIWVPAHFHFNLQFGRFSETPNQLTTPFQLHLHASYSGRILEHAFINCSAWILRVKNQSMYVVHTYYMQLVMKSWLISDVVSICTWDALSMKTEVREVCRFSTAIHNKYLGDARWFNTYSATPKSWREGKWQVFLPVFSIRY